MRHSIVVACPEEHVKGHAFWVEVLSRGSSGSHPLVSGSLPRPVDVVPSHWHDTSDYQRSFAEHDRGVKILDKKVPTTLHNMPFRHIKLISERCVQCVGGLKKASGSLSM